MAGFRRKYVTPGAVVQAAAREPADQAPARVGFTATRTLGGAVIRNRARRRLKEAVRRAASAAAPGIDYVVIARAGTIDRPFDALIGDVGTAFAALARPDRRRAPQGARA